MKIYPGAMHIHSIYSDGTGTIPEIAHAAKKAGLEWIIITDHNKIQGKEGIYEGVCVIIGEEISPKGGNHYLALGIKDEIKPTIPVADFIQEVKNQGGFGFIAHPEENLSRKNSYKALIWKDWDVKGFDGVEIWNYLSDWADNYDEYNLFNSIYEFLFRNKILSGPTKKVLKLWDKFNNEMEPIMPAIGGVDAHALKIKKWIFRVTIFPYLSSFKNITNLLHIEEDLPQDFEGRKKLILNALKKGQNIIINNNKQLREFPLFYIENKTDKAYSGDLIKDDGNCSMTIKLPQRAQIKVLRNGENISEIEAKALELSNLNNGKYRFEAYYKNHPWIFSNPISII